MLFKQGTKLNPSLPLKTHRSNGKAVVLRDKSGKKKKKKKKRKHIQPEDVEVKDEPADAVPQAKVEIEYVSPCLRFKDGGILNWVLELGWAHQLLKGREAVGFGFVSVLFLLVVFVVSRTQTGFFLK